MMLFVIIGLINYELYQNKGLLGSYLTPSNFQNSKTKKDERPFNAVFMMFLPWIKKKLPKHPLNCYK